MEKSREKVGGDSTCSSTLHLTVFYCVLLLCSSAGGLEVEMDERSRSDSRDLLTPELQDPAPQKKKKKKRAATIGNNTAPTVIINDTC